MSPEYSALYDFTKDQGSLIAGLLALLAAGVAGGLTYCIGSLQVKSAQNQLRHMQEAAKEVDRRSREDLLEILDRQARRITALAGIGIAAAEKHGGSPANPTVPASFAEAFRIAWSEPEAHGISTLVPGKIYLVATDLRISIEHLDSVITVKAPLVELSWAELIEALREVHRRATELRTCLAEGKTGWVRDDGRNDG